MYIYWEEIFFHLIECLPPKNKIMVIGRAYFLLSFELRTLGGLIFSHIHRIMNIGRKYFLSGLKLNIL